MKSFSILGIAFLLLLLLVLHPLLNLYASNENEMSQVETVLKQAAGGAHHRDRDSTERAIYDITFLFEQSWNAKEKSQDAARKTYAMQARALIMREARIGSFHINKTGPLLKMIEELMTD